jgi:hypothetical protein
VQTSPPEGATRAVKPYVEPGCDTELGRSG